jgi:hypothetical protein
MRRFHTDALAALAKADKLTHSFADESGLDVQAYMMAKYNLYREAGETNQDLMVRRLHKGLDLALAAIVSLKTNGNTLHDFTSRVTAYKA